MNGDERKSENLGQTGKPERAGGTEGIAEPEDWRQRFARSRSDFWFGGVAGGLARQCQVPSWLVRGLFVLFGMLYGASIPVYLILWALLPAEPADAANAVEPPAPLFRSVDWRTFWLTTAVLFIAYFWTLAPDLTLEDSGELAVGSYYAGVPHPPGYPVWTLYTWAFTKLIPFSNIAWRVAISSAVAAAFACGLLGLMVSRGSSMILEGIPGFKGIDRKLENRLCMAVGFTSGLLLGFNGFMWSQAVIVEVYTLSVLSLMGVLVLMLRWVYAPFQRKFLYWAFFVFGICFTNHQTLIVAAMGLQVLIVAVDRKLGRDVYLASSVLYLLGLFCKAKGWITSFDSNVPLFIIYNAVGIGSLYAFFWFSVKSSVLTRWKILLGHGAVNLILLWVWMRGKGSPDGGMSDYTFTMLMIFFNPGMVGMAYFYSLLTGSAEKALSEWRPVLIMGLLWIAGAAFYFYMPLASMTNPPMNWGYPRTVEGFVHALTRGQYEQTNPTESFIKFLGQIRMYIEGAALEFSLTYLLVGLLPFLFLFRMQKRERAWIIGLTAIYLCLAVLLLILLNPTTDRQSRELNRVFFTASHVIVSVGIGYGLTLIGGLLLTQYQRMRFPLLVGGAAGAGIGVFFAVVTVETTNYPLMRLAGYFGVLVPAVFTGLILFARDRAPFALYLALVVAVPVQSVLAHWSDNEQRGHLFGYWFGHDMFAPPFEDDSGQSIYPDMARDAVLFGGTDPGRFNPTYMIFAESFIDPEDKRDPDFDRRDVYLITQNALADGTYLAYIRAHYNRSAQIDPPFFQDLVRSEKARTVTGETNSLSKLLAPLDTVFMSLGERIEKRRRVETSWFDEDDLLDLDRLVSRWRGSGPTLRAVDTFVYSQLSDRTRSAIENGELADVADDIADDLNELIEGDILYDADRFAEVDVSDRSLRFVAQNPQGPTRIRLNRLLIEEAYPEAVARSVGGVYPDLEIYTPSLADSQRAFEEYVVEAQKRLHLGQLKPGEDVRIVNDRVQVSGQVAVMAINALLTKVIFQKNPDHEFYLEESFPLEWMYPHLTPFGIILKINREPIETLPEEVFLRDHMFWRKYSERLIGDWIDYDTPIAEIAAFAERVYLRRDLTGFQGDPKFVRDDNAQKAFSKLRSAIAGTYSWRLTPECPERFRPKTDLDQQRILKEADFAFRQSFAFCPYSPEALYRYVNLLVSVGRVDEALIIAETCYKFDLENYGIVALIRQLRTMKQQGTNALMTANPIEVRGKIAELERRYLTNTSDFELAFDLITSHLTLQNTNAAIQLLDNVTQNPDADVQTLLTVAQAYAQLGRAARLEIVFLRILQQNPTNPEAWYDLAGVQMALDKRQDALGSLREAIMLSAERRKTDPEARDLRIEAAADPRFEPLRQLPEYQAFMRSE